MTDAIAFNTIDRAQPVFVKLCNHLDERITYLGKQLEGDKGPDETANLRGRIAECRRIQALGAPDPSVTSLPTIG